MDSYIVCYLRRCSLVSMATRTARPGEISRVAWSLIPLESSIDTLPAESYNEELIAHSTHAANELHPLDPQIQILCTQFVEKKQDNDEEAVRQKPDHNSQQTEQSIRRIIVAFLDAGGAERRSEDHPCANSQPTRSPRR